MRITQGRGNNRRNVIDFPTGQIVRSAPEKEQQEFVGAICNLLGVK